MSYIPNQDDLSLIKQANRELFVKVELLNHQFKVLERLDGSLISDHLNIDRESKQRRTYSCEIYVSDSSFLLGNDKKIWIDKYIRVYYGIRSCLSEMIHWYLIGTFTYLDAAYQYSTSEHTLSLSCSDLMADYDGTKNGELEGYSLTIPAGEPIRSSVITILKQAGIHSYLVEDIQKEIPYDLEFNDTTTYCDVLTKICELYDSWEFYFDTDGTFVWRKIPTGLHEPAVLDQTLLDGLIISEEQRNSFQDIYNVTEVWGKVLELSSSDRYSEKIRYSPPLYSVVLDDVSSLEDLEHLAQIGLKIPETCQESPCISINGLEAIPILNDDGSALAAGKLVSGITYVFQYRRTLKGQVTPVLYLLGQYQARGIYREMNPDCPFSVTSLGYEIRHKVSYEHLYSDDLCYNQAEYLTYETTAMMDTITLTCMIIPWLEVNQKIYYTSNITKRREPYLIKSISWASLDGTMTLELYRFRESFSYIKRN